MSLAAIERMNTIQMILKLNRRWLEKQTVTATSGGWHGDKVNLHIYRLANYPVLDQMPFDVRL